MNKELEEAIKTCNEIIKENKGTIKILQRTLKSETEEEYLQEQIKAIKTVLNYIDNSIPKEKVKKVIEDLEDKAKRIAGTYQYSDSAEDLENKKTEVRLYRTISEVLQELLKEE